MSQTIDKVLDVISALLLFLSIAAVIGLAVVGTAVAGAGLIARVLS